MDALARLGFTNSASKCNEYQIIVGGETFAIKSDQKIPSTYLTNIIGDVNFNPLLPININKPEITAEFMRFFLEYMSLSQKEEPKINEDNNLYNIGDIFPLGLTMLFGKYFIARVRKEYNTVDSDYFWIVKKISKYLIAADAISAEHLCKILAKLLAQCIRYKPIDKLAQILQEEKS